jgi:hypothetical protein
MSTYTPDSWVIVKIQSEKHGTIHKVLAGWAGSYLYGASWKLSSGIVTFEDKGNYYESLQDSGSTYILYKSSERMSAIMASTFASIEEQLKGNGGTIEVIDSGDYVNSNKGVHE